MITAAVVILVVLLFLFIRESQEAEKEADLSSGCNVGAWLVVILLFLALLTLASVAGIGMQATK